MPSSLVLKGIGSSAPAEKVFLAGYNASGAARGPGTVVCWDAVASDGFTFVLPTATGFINYGLLAGVLTDTCSSADYTGAIQAHGPCTALTWGVASTFIPGAGLIMVADKAYFAYGTDLQRQVQYEPHVNALQTNATAATLSAKVYLKAM